MSMNVLRRMQVFKGLGVTVNSCLRRKGIVAGQCLGLWLLLTCAVSLTSYASEFEELIRAVEKGDASKVSALLDNGADVNAKTHTGATPLIYASWHGHSDVVKVLLDHGADLHAKTHDGQTALSLATDKRHSEVVRLLQEHGHGASTHGQAAHDEHEAGHTNMMWKSI